MSSSEEWFVKGKTVIVTGANTGIGRATALELTRRGAKRVIIACRNLTQGEEAAKEIRDKTGVSEETVVVRHLDLSSIQSVRRFAKEINETEPALHVLVNNAGIYGPDKRTLSVDGNEITFATNHLGHFLVTTLLLDLLKKSAPSRIVTVSSDKPAFWWCRPTFVDDVNFEKPGSYGRVNAYNQTKLANVLFTRELHKRLQLSGNSNVTTYVLHPGVVGSDIARNFNSMLRKIFLVFAKSTEDGAKNSVYCASQPGIENLSSSYFKDRVPVDPGSLACDEVVAEKLWKLSEELVAKVPQIEYNQSFVKACDNWPPYRGLSCAGCGVTSYS